MTTKVDLEMSNEDYHDKSQHPHISSSDIKEIAATSVLHWAIKQDKPRKETPAMRMGSMLHSMILEPHKKEYVRGLPNRLKRKEWAAMEEKAAKQGKILVTEGEYDEAEELAAIALDTCKLLRESIKKENFVAEASVFTYLDDFNLAVKARPDGLLMPTKEGEQGIILDIKKTKATTPKEFEKEIQRYSYHLQASYYMMVMRQAEMPCNKFYFIAVNSDTGVATVHELSELYLKYAEKRMYEAMHKLVHAQSTGQFDTGWNDVNVIHLPAWLEDELGEEPF